MRRALRTLTEALATRSGLTAAARRLRHDTVAVVAYHNVVPEDQAGRGDTSLHLPLQRFLRQVDQLSRTHEVVDIRTVARDGPRDRPTAVITFDDAYHGAVNLALPELAQRGLPAVIFVSPGLLGTQSTWWDELGEAGALTPEIRAVALHELRGLESAVRESYLDDLEPQLLPETYRIATLDELLAQVGDGISVGSHAWHHEYLPGLDRNTLARSLTRSLEWVRDLGDAACPWLALPYGAGSPALGRFASNLGYNGVLRIAGGLWDPGKADPLVPRINVPAGLTVEGLELRTSGLR